MKPNLNLPPDVARERQMQAAQQNQLYSLAFTIYNTLLPVYARSSGYDARDVADEAIANAKTFRQAVEEDMKRGNQS